MGSPSLRERMTALVSELQDDYCARLEALDGVASFGRDEWQRPGGGGGGEAVPIPTPAERPG